MVDVVHGQDGDERREPDDGPAFELSGVAKLQSVGAFGQMSQEQARVLRKVSGPAVDVGHQRTLVATDELCSRLTR